MANSSSDPYSLKWTVSLSYSRSGVTSKQYASSQRRIFEQNHDAESLFHNRTQPVSLKFEQSNLPHEGEANSAYVAEISDLVDHCQLLTVRNKLLRQANGDTALTIFNVVATNRFGLYTNGKLIDKLLSGKSFPHEY